MKKYLKLFVAVLVVFVGSVATAFYLQNKISFTSALVGLGGFIILYPAISAYVKWFDNLFGE